MNSSPVKILLIEDNEDDYLIVRDLLALVETQQYKLAWASTYDAGLQAMQSHQFDVLLVDYRLVERTGIEFLHEARQQGYRTPILLLTGHADRDVDLESMRAGAADFLDKNELSSAMLERSTRHAIERSRAEEALLRSEERYRAFIVNSSEAIWCCELEQPIPIAACADEQIDLLYRNSYLGECNEVMARMYGCASPQDIIGARLDDLLKRSNPDNIEYLHSFIRSRYRLSDAESCEVDRQGRTRYFLNNLIGIIENGALQRIWGTQRDVSAQRETDHLRSQLAAIVEFSHDAIVGKSMDGIVLSWNRSAERIYGYSADEIIGRHISLLAPPERRNEWCQIWHAVERGEYVQQFETVRVRKDGRRINVALTVSPIKNSSGQITGASTIARDITERKQTEEELNQFFTLSLDMLCIAGFDGYFKRINPAWANTLGYTAEELLSQPYLDFVHPDDFSVTKDEATSINGGSDTFSFENRYKCKDGSYKWLMWNSATVPERQLVYAIARDITERKQTEANLKAYAAQLERSNRELQDFAYVASHDLQEPLRKIQAFGERLQSEYSEVIGEDGVDYLQRMQNAAGRMQGLIKDLLIFSRVTTQAQPFVPVDLSQIAQEVLCDLETSIEKTGGQVDVGPLPTVEADPLQMRQVLQNLISNALKFNREGAAPTVKIRGDVTAVGLNSVGEVPAIHALCHITVQDNGIGFDEKHLERIFAPFQRLHGRSRFEGTGMGLAICRKIAERHRGYITARSVPGEGATFIVTLPIRKLDSPGS
ncbi:MAG TPA: PAS domain S-box protein [Abditibacteriaceae bacterium]|jgi:PAS domain S-box-containing protein